MKISIAIDGPAGAGKSTIAKELAKKYNLMYINTGAMYRAVTFIALENNIEPNDKTLLQKIKNCNMHFDNDDLILNNENLTNKIYTPFISDNVSRYACIPEIREILVQMQRKISKEYDVIMDGRDIGTVVLKDATIKFYLTASAKERAKRRYNELTKKGLQVEFDDILKSIEKRDYADSHREIDPLRKAEDAIEIDSSNLNKDEVIYCMSSYINNILK